MTSCSSLSSEYFTILREHPLRNNNQQSNLPQKKKPKDLRKGPVYKIYLEKQINELSGKDYLKLHVHKKRANRKLHSGSYFRMQEPSLF